MPNPKLSMRQRLQVTPVQQYAYYEARDVQRAPYNRLSRTHDNNDICMACGAGKTLLMCANTYSGMIRRKWYSKAIIATSYSHVREGFILEEDTYFSPGPNRAGFLIPKSFFYVPSPDASSIEQTLDYLEGPCSKVQRCLVVCHMTLALLERNCSDRLKGINWGRTKLVVDESHHCSIANDTEDNDDE